MGVINVFSNHFGVFERLGLRRMSFIFFFAPRYISFVLLGCSRNILWALKVHSPFQCELILVGLCGCSRYKRAYFRPHSLHTENYTKMVQM